MTKSRQVKRKKHYEKIMERKIKRRMEMAVKTSDNYEDRYAKATHRVMKLMAQGNTPAHAAYTAAMDHGLGLNQYGRLLRETRERYEETN